MQEPKIASLRNRSSDAVLRGQLSAASRRIVHRRADVVAEARAGGVGTRVADQLAARSSAPAPEGLRRRASPRMPSR
jgi:hypothetical protein